MTGFARAETKAPWGRLSWELRSVNHRYLDLTFKLPDEFRALETDWRQRTSAVLGRGKVELALRFAADASQVAGLEIDPARLAAVCAALDAVAAQVGATLVPDPIRLLAWPGVVRQTGADFAPILAAATTLFAQVLLEFNDMRAREGERMAVHIEERARLLETHAARVSARAPQVREVWLERLKARLAELAIDLDPMRLAQEAALLAQRLDVDEELSRLASHLVEVRKALHGEEAVGRRLDFLMQELNRETNTLSSKSQDAEMTRLAVEMKVAIEQMREQVQNIE